jgi:hypothetical protein
VPTRALLETGSASRVAPNILSVAAWGFWARRLGGKLYAPLPASGPPSCDVDRVDRGRRPSRVERSGASPAQFAIAIGVVAPAPTREQFRNRSRPRKMAQVRYAVWQRNTSCSAWGPIPLVPPSRVGARRSGRCRARG